MKLDKVDIFSRENNLNLTRLAAAISVTFGHSFAMLNPTGAHYDIIPGVHSGLFGFLAVAIFFGLSGLLITQSYLRQERWTAFLVARCLRIFPGLVFANFVTVLVVGIFVKEQGWSLIFDLKNWRYLLNASIFHLGDYQDVFKMMPHNSPNGSLWTLPIEFRLYLFVMAVGLVGILRNRILYASILVTLVLLVILRVDFVVLKLFPLAFIIASYEGTYLSLPLCFAIGMLAYLYREKFPLLIGISCLGLALVPFVDGWLFMTIAVVYAALTFGLHPKLYISRLNFKNDLSYGVYVLSWPIQQTMIYLKVTEDPFQLFVLSMCFILPLAFISWKWIEMPAIKLKGRSTEILESWIERKFKKA